MRNRTFLAFLVGVIASGCSGMSATQVGQTAGSIAGGAIVPGIGAPVGTLIGTLAGLVIDSQLDKAREQKERVSLGDQLARHRLARAGSAEDRPLGDPTRVWVDEQFDHGRLLAGHFELRAIP